MRKYKIHTEAISDGQTYHAECNAIEFVNQGSDEAQINGRTVAAGSSFSYYGQQDEMDTTAYKIVFVTTANPLILVITKQYV